MSQVYYMEEMTNVFKILVGKPEREGTLWILGRR
jgi:hypothetical protein